MLPADRCSGTPADTAWRPEADLLWPTAQQQRLVDAALRPGPAAAAALAEWRTHSGWGSYEQIDFEASRLLPAVYRNLSATGGDDPWLRELRSLHRCHLLRNAARQRDLLHWIGRLNRLGITPVLLKGQALVAGGYYRDSGERTMVDSDVLVAPEDASAVEQLLRSEGYRRVPAGGSFPYRHAHCWRRGEGDEIDLHLKLLPAPFGAWMMPDLLGNAERRQMGGAELWLPSATDLLLHACVHGRIVGGKPPQVSLHWITDAARLIQQAKAMLDWERLAHQAQKLRATLPLREALGYLRFVCGVEVPEEVLAKLLATPLSRAEMRPYFRHLGPASKRPSLLQLCEDAQDDYLAVRESLSQPPSTAGALRHCTYRTLRSLWRGTGWKRAWGMLSRTVRQGSAGIFAPCLVNEAQERLAIWEQARAA